MKQLMGFKSNATATLLGTNALPDAIGGATSPEKLGTALPGVYAKDKVTGKLIMINTPALLAAAETFLIARGNPKDSNPNDTDDTKEGATFSDEIDRRNYTLKKYLANAGAAKVITLGGAGSNLIGGAVTIANSTAGVTIVDNSPNIMSDWKTKTYEVRPAAALDARAVADLLVIKINADPDRLVDATATGTTAAGVLVLTHRKKGVTFDAHGTDETICQNCTKVVTTKPARVDNGIAKIRELELECHGYQGGTRRGDGQLGDILPYTQIDIDAGTTGFVVYHFTWERNVQRQGAPVDAKASRFLRLYLVVPTASLAMIAAIDTLFAAVIVTPAGVFGEDEEEDEEGTPLAATEARGKKEEKAEAEAKTKAEAKH